LEENFGIDACRDNEGRSVGVGGGRLCLINGLVDLNAEKRSSSGFWLFT
jgi:hypothetical protein